MARILNTALGVRKAIARYRWYGRGIQGGFIDEWAFLCIAMMAPTEQGWRVCCIGRGCGQVCSF